MVIAGSLHLRSRFHLGLHEWEQNGPAGARPFPTSKTLELLCSADVNPEVSHGRGPLSTKSLDYWGVEWQSCSKLNTVRTVS
eukprot:413225-Amphidinium_carterae.1